MLEEISYEAQPLVPRLLDELNTGQKRVDQESKHIIKNSKYTPSSCEIEDSVETHIFASCV